MTVVESFAVAAKEEGDDRAVLDVTSGSRGATAGVCLTAVGRRVNVFRDFGL